MAKQLWRSLAISWVGVFFCLFGAVQVAAQPISPFSSSASFLFSQSSPLTTEPETTLLASEKRYQDSYRWSGPDPHGLVGLGMQDHRSAGLPWYTTTLGVAGNGIHFTPVGGKLYDGWTLPTPGVTVIYGAPGAFRGGGPVRIASTTFRGVSHFTHKSYCQALRLALYGDGSRVKPKDFYMNGVLTKDADKLLIDPDAMANTAQVWFWTMPECGSALIPLGGDGVFGHVSGLDLELVDRDLPRGEFTGDITLQAQRWTNQIANRINFTVVASDAGSGVQKVTAKVVGPELKRTLFEKEVACDYRHLGAPWNKDRPWLAQVCPNEFRVNTGINNGELKNGISKVTTSVTDLAGQQSAQEALELWVDRTQPNVQLKRTQNTDDVWQNGEKTFTVQANAQDQLSGVKKLTLFARQGAASSKQLAEYVLCTKTGRKAQCPRQAEPHTFTIDPSVLSDGKTTLSVSAEDLAGNSTKSNGVEVGLDRQPPNAPRQLALNQQKNAAATLSWNAAFDQPPGSGIAGYRYRYQVDSRPVSGWQQTASTHAQLSATEKANSIHVWLQTVDNAGNLSVSAELTKTTPTVQPVKPAPPAKPPTKPCTTRKPCKTTPPCKRNGKPCKYHKPAKKPCRKKRCKKTKLPVKPQLAPCLRKKPKNVTIKGTCKLNLWVRGMDISQGPAGARFDGEQPLPNRSTSLSMSYENNAVSRFFDLTPALVDNGKDEQGRIIKKEVFTVNSDYWQAPKLIANKPTLVRVYTAFSGVKVPVMSRVTLVGYRRTSDGSLIKLGSAISTASLTPSPKTPMTTLRSTREGAKNFTLPTSWVTPISASEPLVLQAIARPEVILQECDSCKNPANTTYLKDITFFEPLPGRTAENTPTTALPITVFKIKWNGNSVMPKDEEIKSAFQDANRLYPLPKDTMQVDIRDKIFDLGTISKNKKGWDCSEIIEKFNMALHNDSEIRDTNAPGWEKEDDYYSNVEFRPERPWPRYVGMMSGNTDCGGRAPVRGRTMISQADSSLAHELGHNYNRQHASSAHKEDAGTENVPGKYSTEPWPDDYLFGSEQGSINGFSYTGFTSSPTQSPQQLTQKAVPSFTALGYGTGQSHPHEMMSYGAPPSAISPNTWNALLDGFARFPNCKLGACPYPFPPEKTTNNQSPVKAVTALWGKSLSSNTPAPGSTPGTVVVSDPSVVRDRVVFVESHAYRGDRLVPSPKIEPLLDVAPSLLSTSVEGSPWRFVAYDVDGNQVSELRVSPPLISEVGGTLSGDMFLPASAVRIRLLYEDEVIAERVASPNPPTAKLLAPVAGERWRNDGTTSVRKKAAILWQASDPDNDQLTIFASYMNNAGPGGSGITYGDLDGEFVNPREFPPSTNAQIYLKVSDGWSTIKLLGPPFSVDPHPFPSEKIFMLDPKKQTFPIDRMSAKTVGTPFTGGANDPNTFSSIDDDRLKGVFPYRWYLNGRLLSKRQSFVTTKLACSPSPARVTITVKGSYNQVGKKTVAIPLTPKKPPRVCKKRKRRHKR